jgi:hypothetical protein
MYIHTKESVKTTYKLTIIKSRTKHLWWGQRRAEMNQLVMAAEEHYDASPDDVKPGLVLPQNPAQPSSSSWRLTVLPMADLHGVHPELDSSSTDRVIELGEQEGCLLLLEYWIYRPASAVVVAKCAAVAMLI